MGGCGVFKTSTVIPRPRLPIPEDAWWYRHFPQCQILVYRWNFFKVSVREVRGQMPLSSFLVRRQRNQGRVGLLHQAFRMMTAAVIMRDCWCRNAATCTIDKAVVGCAAKKPTRQTRCKREVLQHPPRVHVVHFIRQSLVVEQKWLRRSINAPVSISISIANTPLAYATGSKAESLSIAGALSRRCFPPRQIQLLSEYSSPFHAHSTAF